MRAELVTIMGAKKKVKAKQNPISNTIDIKEELSNLKNTKDSRAYKGKQNKKQTLKYKEPKKYKNILNDLKEGKSLTETASNNKCARGTVDRIKYDNRDQLINWKWKQSQKIGDIIEDGLQVLKDNVDGIPKGSLPLALGILIDKKDMLDSSLTPETTKQSVIAHVNLNELIDNLSSKNDSLHGESAKVLDV